jgi:hypothetical protein
MRAALQSLSSERRKATWARLTANIFDYHRVGYDRRTMSFLSNGCVGLGAAGCEFLWRLKEERGAVILELSSERELTCRLVEGKRGVWRGRWRRFEQMPIELTPIGEKTPVRDGPPGWARRLSACLVMVANRPRKFYSKLLKSCERYGIEPVVLGCGELYPGNGLKVRLLQQFVEEAGHRFAHLILCDAYDVVLAARLEEILERFRQFKSPLVFAAERNCAPEAARESEYPATASPYKYLNAGFWVGEMDAVRQMFETIGRRRIGDHDDQRLFTDLFLNRSAPIVLDHDCRLCQCLFRSERDLRYEPVARRIVNRLTGNAPCVFHGNGNADMSQVFGWLKL